MKREAKKEWQKYRQERLFCKMQAAFRIKSSTIHCCVLPFFSAFKCNFEASFCGFKQAKDDKFDWTRKTGGTPSSSTGPSGATEGGNAKTETFCTDFLPHIYQWQRTI